MLGWIWRFLKGENLQEIADFDREMPIEPRTVENGKAFVGREQIEFLVLNCDDGVGIAIKLIVRLIGEDNSILY